MHARQLASLGFLSLLLQPTSASAKERLLISTLRGWYTTALEELAVEYEQLHPDIDVEINLQPDQFSLSRYYTAQMAVDRAAAPDVVHGNLLGVDENFHAQRFLSVNEYLERPNPYAGNVVWRDLFDPALLASLAVDGIHDCVLPLDFCDLGVFYNQDIFDRLGLAPPETWDEWIALCQTIEDQGYIPIAIPATVQDDFTLMFNQLFEDACMRNFIPSSSPSRETGITFRQTANTYTICTIATPTASSPLIPSAQPGPFSMERFPTNCPYSWKPIPSSEE